MDDGVTPTPSKRMQGDTNGSGEARNLKSETFSSESKYQQEIRDILE